MSSHKTAATVAHTIGIDTGKNTLHLIGLDDKGAIAICARSSCRAPALRGESHPEAVGWISDVGVIAVAVRRPDVAGVILP
jgi:hypothetical protein